MNSSLLDQVLQMPPAERVSFAEIILASIDQENDQVKALWLQEVKDRMAAVEAGKANLMDLKELLHENSNP